MTAQVQHGALTLIGPDGKTPIPARGTEDGYLIISGGTGGGVGLTDDELRATPVPVTGTVTAQTGLTQPLTDTELRAVAVPVSAAALPLPTGAATEVSAAAIASALAGTLTVSAINRGALVDRSGTITTGGTAQQAAASNAARKAVVVQNLNATTDLWVRTNGTASAGPGSYWVQPGLLLVFDAALVGTGAVSIFSTLTGHAYTCQEL